MVGSCGVACTLILFCFEREPSHCILEARNRYPEKTEPFFLSLSLYRSQYLLLSGRPRQPLAYLFRLHVYTRMRERACEAILPLDTV